MAEDIELRRNPDAWRAMLHRSEVAKDLERRGIKIEGRAKELASTPGAGRVYRRRGVEHQASAPGQPPAPDTGQLRASITHSAGEDDQSVFVDVGTNLATGRFLEEGTQHMDARPFLRPALPAGNE